MTATNSVNKPFTLRDAQGMWWLLHEVADTDHFSDEEKSTLGMFFFEMQMLDTAASLMHHNLSAFTSGSPVNAIGHQGEVLENLRAGGDLLDPYQPLFQKVLLLAKKVRPTMTEYDRRFLWSEFDHDSWVREELGL